MLRITPSKEPGTGIQTLIVEGTLAGAWVPILRDSVAVAPGGSGHQVRVDLAGVSFVDADGAALLFELRTRNVVFTRCSRFVAELLGGGQDHDPVGSPSGGSPR